MAYRRLSSATLDAGREAELRSGIVEELRRPDGAPPAADAPVIYMEESGLPDNYTHWYAVWDRFAGVDSETRSRIVFDAVREVLGEKQALRVAGAMGLTPVEAENMGLEEGPTQDEQRDAA